VRGDRADVEVAIGPAVQPFADAERELVVDRRVTERALDADRTQPSALEESRQADDGLQPEQGERRGGIVEVHVAAAKLPHEIGRQPVEIDLEPHRKRRTRAHSRADAAELRSGDCLVQPKRVSPECLVAEGVEPERPQAFLYHRASVGMDGVVAGVTAVIGEGHGRRRECDEPACGGGDQREDDGSTYGSAHGSLLTRTESCAARNVTARPWTATRREPFATSDTLLT
jgi:hypothetical protein